MQDNKNISKSVIRRLPRYYRFLGELLKEGVEKISSRELSERMRLTASQIRQDLNCFGGFGQQGYGYNVAELREQIGAILHLNDMRTVILIGAGNLGRAVAVHIDFERYGCRLVGIFDRDDTMTGESISGIRIRAMDEIRMFCCEEHPAMAILCIPRSGAEDVVKTLIGCGVRAFWNFSHYDINVDYPDAAVENVHLTDSLMTLSYLMEEKDEPEDDTVTN